MLDSPENFEVSVPPFACNHIITIDMHRKLNSRYKMAVVHLPNENAVMMKTQAYFRKVTPSMLILFPYSFERQGYRSCNFRTRNSYSKYNDLFI